MFDREEYKKTISDKNLEEKKCNLISITIHGFR